MGRAGEEGNAVPVITIGLVARGMLVVMLLWALANVIWLGRDVLFIAFFAALVASFLSIFVDPLERRGVKRSIAAPLVLLALFAVLAVIGVITWPILTEQFGLVQQQLPEAIGRAEEWLGRQFRNLSGAFGRQGEAVEEQVRSRASQEIAELVGGTIPLLNTAIGAITGLLLIIFAGLFMAIEPRIYARGLRALVPRSKRDLADDVMPKIGETLRRWMAATALGMITIAVLTTVGLALIGIPAALALGVIAGLLEFIPYVGPALSFVPAIAVALAISPSKAVWVIGLFALIQFIESNIMMPLLVRGVIKLPPALTLLFQALMATLFGFFGLLLAVPILAAGKVLVQELYVDEVANEA